MSLNNFALAVRINKEKKCLVPHCPVKRWGLSRYCNKHKLRDHYWGDPEAERINRGEINPYIEEVTPIINNNLSHEGIQTGIRLFDLWMKNSAAGANLPAAEYFTRLHDLGVSPVELLKIAAACYLFAIRNPNRIKTVRQRNYFLANRLFQARTTGGRGKVGNRYPHEATGKKRRETGEYVQKNLSVLLVNICAACNRKEEEEQKKLKAQYAPLSV